MPDPDHPVSINEGRAGDAPDLLRAGGVGCLVGANGERQLPLFRGAEFILWLLSDVYREDDMILVLVFFVRGMESRLLSSAVR